MQINLYYKQAFVDKFSRDLAVEYRADGIVVQTVLPGLVATTMPGAGRKMDASLIAPTAEVFVDASWRSLGIEPRSAPYWVHRILVINRIIQLIPINSN